MASGEVHFRTESWSKLLQKVITLGTSGPNYLYLSDVPLYMRVEKGFRK